MEKNIVKDFLFLLLIFLSRLPFVFSGCGLDGDSWEVFRSAHILHDSFMYIPSRLPGYPVHEFLCSLVVGLGPLGTNLVSALASTLLAVSFLAVLRHFHFKYVYLATAALVFVPVIYINSVTTIDYVVAIAFVLTSLAFLLKEKLFHAALFLALAVGCRITSLVMLLPFCIMMFDEKKIRRSLNGIILFGVLTILIATAFFLPLILQFGSSFFTYYDVPYPSIPKVIYKFVFETWGIVGATSLLFGAGFMLLSKRKMRQYLFGKVVGFKFIISWLVAIDVYIILFLKLPVEAGYLIPIIPFVILLFGRYLDKTAFTIFSCGLIVSSFVFSMGPSERLDASTPSGLNFSFNAGGEKLIVDILKGPQLAYESRRKNGVQFIDRLITSFDTLTKPTAILAGRWYSQLTVNNKRNSTNPRILFYADEKEIVSYAIKDYKIYYLPRQDYYNKLMKGAEVDLFGGKPYLDVKKY